MAAVQQRVLNWLYSILTSEYKDITRTYNDVAQTLSHYSSLSPRTDVYTYENGVSALLLHLSGTLPVTFRGTVYRFPIALWIPHGYPQEAPLVYVTPTDGMVVRPGQHVDPQGKVYHPYLVGWAEYWDKSNILDFLAILRDIFAKEPPVIARQQQNPPPRAQPAPIPPPVPPLPSNIIRPIPTPASPSLSQQNQARPPLPPPKPGSISQPNVPERPQRQDSGPYLPPLPSQSSRDAGAYGSPISQPQNGQLHAPRRSSSLRYETAPLSLPPPTRQQSLKDGYSPSPVSPITPSPPEIPHGRPSYTQQYQQSQYPPYPVQQPNPQQVPPYTQPQPQFSNQPPQQWQQSQSQYQYQQYSSPQPHQQPKQPQPNLLDAPLTLPIPSSTPSVPAPPVPPNPEKDILLHNLGKALHSQRAHTRNQTASSLPGLASQHDAMLNTLSSMMAELSSLESLSTLLASNTSILHTALHSADSVIENSQHRTAPNIDEILVAPTVVGNQLYELVCEERALGDAVFVLGRAVERGRISAAVLVKLTRGLAREWFLKKALVRKIGRGMGLASG
ncbi:hypothetical protein B7494_g2707 [Chlorociboria aeruginascens]|nr:hypothetical protein B7494_g2707 [Chlorociboria aeruginascens]